eukprot:COSAG01_NODE_11119_length_2003_cov_0.986870_3_plen_312_part_00
MHGILTRALSAVRPYYGPSEKRVGTGLADASATFSAGSHSDDLRIFTKVGVIRDGSTVAHLGATAQGAHTSFEESTVRLGVSRLAGLRFHDIPDDKGKGSVPTTDALIKAAAEPGTGMIAGIVSLKEKGLVDQVSIGMNAIGGRRADWDGGEDGSAPVYGTPDQILDLIRAVPEGTFDSVLMASGWNLLYHEGAVVLQECAAKGIAVHNAGTFATGLLAGGFSYLYREAPPEMVAKTEQWAALCERYSLKLPAVAMAFSALPVCVKKVVIGCSAPSDVQDCVSHCHPDIVVPTELWAEAQKLGLLPRWLKF